MSKSRARVGGGGMQTDLSKDGAIPIAEFLHSGSIVCHVRGRVVRVRRAEVLGR